MAVGGIAPAAPGADVHAWATTGIPRATLHVAGKGLRVSALSADGRVAVVAGPRGVYLFRVPSEGSWGSVSAPTARLRVPRARLANLSADALSADGTTVLVAVGPRGKSPAVAYVFHASSPGAWQSSERPAARLTNAAEPSGFGSGAAISSDGTTALVGELGGAAVFHVGAAGVWRTSSTPTATLVADQVAAQVGGAGTAVALSADGTTALIGTTSYRSSVGAAYIFRVAEADAWLSSATPEAALTDGPAGLFGDGFGGAVSLSPDGLTALVGAPNLAFGPAGAAYLFQVPGPDAWTTTAEPEAVLGRSSGPVSGWSVALSAEGTALVGAPSLSGRHGAADVFRAADTDRSWGFDAVTQTELTNAASPPRDLFGAGVSVSADGTTALVSSVRASFVFTQAGSRAAGYCYVPYVAGEVLRSAKQAIKSTRCRVGRVSLVSASRVQTDRVISQSPRPGERLVRRRTVDLRVGKGP